MGNTVQKINSYYNFIQQYRNLSNIGCHNFFKHTSVANPDPVGSGTFSWIRNYCFGFGYG